MTSFHVPSGASGEVLPKSQPLAALNTGDAPAFRVSSPGADDGTSAQRAFWADQEKRRVRQVHGAVASVLMGGMLPWRSAEERDLIYVLEADTGIEAIDAMPEKIDFVQGGVQRSHVPALRVRQCGRIALLDALRHGEERSRSRSALTATLRQLYASRGMRYIAVERCAVRAEPRFSNGLYVLQARGYEPPLDQELLIIEALTRRGRCTLAELDRATDHPTIRAAALALALKRRLDLDVSTAATPDDIAVSLRPGAGEGGHYVEL